jgi:hypothetical protein
MKFTNLTYRAGVFFFAVLALPLITSACETGSQIDTTLDVRPLEEVYVDRAPQMTEITPTDAVLSFDSNHPLACSVIYGTTIDYGLIAVDQDMNGGAHTDHQPLLLGLEPDTEYHYRLQGTAADGTIYVSDDMMFRTPPPEANAEVNFASLEAGARVLAVSSNLGGAADDEIWGANSAIDGNRGTAWSSDGDGNEAFIEFQLAQPVNLYAIEVWTRTMSNNTAQIISFTLTTNDGTVLGPFTLDDAERAYRFDVDVIASSLRLDAMDSNGGNTGLIEFGAFGEPLD